MEVFCGNYKDYKLKKRIPWLRYIFIFMLVCGTTAATPAVISYYWDGKHSEHTLTEEAARAIAADESQDFNRRLAAFNQSVASARTTMKLALSLTSDPEFEVHAQIQLRNLRVLLNQLLEKDESKE